MQEGQKRAGGYAPASELANGVIEDLPGENEGGTAAELHPNDQADRDEALDDLVLAAGRHGEKEAAVEFESQPHERRHRLEAEIGDRPPQFEIRDGHVGEAGDQDVFVGPFVAGAWKSRIEAAGLADVGFDRFEGEFPKIFGESRRDEKPAVRLARTGDDLRMRRRRRRR